MIYLASRSPRRKSLLQKLSVKFELLDVDIDESWDGKENPSDYVRRLALEKAIAGKSSADRSYPVLGADTEVVLDNQVIGKPVDRSDAINILQKLSGRTHQVYSAVALAANEEHTRLNISHVTFKELSLEHCEIYCDSEEPYGKAGAYGIQGTAATFITRLAGSYSAVMGLPLKETRELLALEDGS